MAEESKREKKLFILFGVVLVASSILLYFVHFAIFRDVNHIIKYGLHELAFIPIEVLLVTLIVHRLLNNREKRAKLNKLNMVIGAFFSEVGNYLLMSFLKFDTNKNNLGSQLKFTTNWKSKDFNKQIKASANYLPEIDSTKIDLPVVKKVLTTKRNFLLRLLENPILLEHETFTELLWAVFHLTDELEARKQFKDLPEADYNHLSGDITRAYSFILIEWLAYMRHLSQAYPYLYSLAVRTNPFDPDAKAEVYS